MGQKITTWGEFLRKSCLRTTLQRALALGPRIGCLVRRIHVGCIIRNLNDLVNDGNRIPKSDLTYKLYMELVRSLHVRDKGNNRIGLAPPAVLKGPAAPVGCWMGFLRSCGPFSSVFEQENRVDSYHLRSSGSQKLVRRWQLPIWVYPTVI